MWARHYKWLFGLAIAAVAGLVGLVSEIREKRVDRLEAALEKHMDEHKAHADVHGALKDDVLRLELQRRRFPVYGPDPLFGGGRGD